MTWRSSIGDRRGLRVAVYSGLVEVGQIGNRSPPAAAMSCPYRHPPVTEVDIANYVITEESEDPLDALTDDRRAEMTDMQFLGDVGPAVVDNHLLRFGGNRAEPC